MSLPPIPMLPKDAHGNRVENLSGLLAVWSTLARIVSQTLPALLVRLAYDIDSHR